MQHLGGPSASGAAIEGTILGNKAESSEMKSDSVALQKSIFASVPLSVNALKSHYDPSQLLTSPKS